MPLSSPHPRRSGFTLVELIVVITIISILAALITAAVVMTRGAASDAKVTAEMRQIDTAIQAFKASYNVGYLPSQLVLRNTVGAYVTSNAAEKASKDFLLKLFPRIDQTANQGWVMAAPANPNAMVVLNGCECLVFFLGGPDGINGFSGDPRIPYKPGQKNKVSFDFGSFGSRLKVGVFKPNTPVLLDPYAEGTADDQPYYYFSSRYGDDYDFSHVIIDPTLRVQLAPIFVDDLNPTRRGFANGKTFQLICAGKDKRAGVMQLSPLNDASKGCVPWRSGTFTLGVVAPNKADEPFDNVGNFYEKKLGVP